LITFPQSEILTSFLNSRSCLFLPVLFVVNIFLQLLGLYRNWSQSLMTLENCSMHSTRVFTPLYVASVFSLNKLDLTLTDSCREQAFYFISFLYFCLLPISLKSGHFDIFPFSMASRILFDRLNCQMSRDEGQRSMVLRACWCSRGAVLLASSRSGCRNSGWSDMGGP
jgi:hypothetical protein